MSSTNRFTEALEEWLERHGDDLERAAQDRRRAEEQRAAVAQEGADSLAALLAQTDHDDPDQHDDDRPMSADDLMHNIEKENRQ